MSGYRVAMDIGGTFTDFVVVDGTDHGETSSGKVLTTPENPATGVLDGLRQFVPAPSAIEFLVHGTTVGLNAFLERKGTRVLLIMTDGLRDSYSIARHDRKELYALRYHKPKRLVPRRDVVEVVERLRWDGSVETPLAAESLDPLFARIRDEGVEAVAVCLIHSYVNPEHELQVRDLLRAEFPDLSITLSHEIAREWREYERASSAVLNAYIAPRVERYLATLEHELGELERVVAAIRDAVERGNHERAQRTPRADSDAALGAGRRDDRRCRTRPLDRPQQPAVHRHGRDIVRPQPGGRRPADRLDARPSWRACPC